MNETAANDDPLPTMMDRYVITLVIPIEYEVRGATIQLAAEEARRILARVRETYPATKLMRIMNDVTYVALEPVVDGSRPPTNSTTPPRGSPPSGSPGTPVVRVAEDLNVVAKVA